MDFRSKNLTRYFVCFTAALILSLSMLQVVNAAQSTKPSNGGVAQRVAEEYLKTGVGLYEKGSYALAKKQFLRAKQWSDYLSLESREQLDAYLTRTEDALNGSLKTQDYIENARMLYAQGDLIGAKASLDKARSNSNLDKNQLASLNLLSDEINSRLLDESAAEDLYHQSVELYRAGELESARAGFSQIVESGASIQVDGVTPGDYIARIDAILAKEAVEKVIDTESSIALEPFDDVTGMLEIPEREQAAPVEIVRQPGVVIDRTQVDVAGADSDASYIDRVTRRMSILRSHTQAVVNDAIAKAREYVNSQNYSSASEVIVQAQRLVNENQLSLGNDLYARYTAQLAGLSQEVAVAKQVTDTEADQSRKQQAITAQSDYRQRMETERNQRICELLENAVQYQREERYDAALGQLEALLALEPQHNQALILKQMIQDMISFKTQLEIAKKQKFERYGVLTDTKEAIIPYAKEINYPKNWAQINARRNEEISNGQDPLNSAVYSKLEKIVNLAALNPDMPLNEAIELLSNSVEPPLSIIVMWSDLSENAGVDKSTPVGMDKVVGIPLRTGLSLLLESVSGGIVDIDYVVDNGVVKIATRDSLQVKYTTVVYDITDLLSPPADYYVSLGGSGSGSGGSGRSGGGGGGGGSGSTESWDEYFDDEEEGLGREDVTAQRSARTSTLMDMIQQTINPDSWYDNGGEGTITEYDQKKLIVYQTPQSHKEVLNLLGSLRERLGHQVSIEARFLIVGENFLEDIGLDVDITLRNLGDKWDPISIRQDHSNTVRPGDTGLPGSFGGNFSNDALQVGGAYGGVLNDLQVDFLLRATQSHRSATSLVAPKITVLSGERAVFRQQRSFNFALQPDVDIRDYAGGVGGTTSRTETEQEYGSVRSGTILNITPTITPDKKHVLLNIEAELRKFLGFEDTIISYPIDGRVITYPVSLPQTEISRIKTRVSVPDSGTLLLGGQKVAEESQTESGVPILSKLPIVGRLFENRSKIKDNNILLILVKPTVILQEETDADALGSFFEEGY